MIFWLAGVLGLALFIAAAYWTIEPTIRGGSEGQLESEPSATPLGTSSPNDPILVGAGDIASCQQNDETTAQLLDAVVSEATGEVVLFAAGDNAYETGTIDEYEQCYEPTWGRHKNRTRPAPGNHEYETTGGAGYFRVCRPGSRGTKPRLLKLRRRSVAHHHSQHE